MTDSSQNNTNTPVLVERKGHVMVITINRPEVRNVINAAVHIGIGEALSAADNDPDVRCVVITGAGEKAFCAGADLVAYSKGERLMPDDRLQAAWGFAGLVTHPISKPLIAAVNGYALAGGFEIALACDLVLASDTATFGLPEVRRGLFAGAGGLLHLTHHLSRKLALELVLTGESINAARAAELGLVNRVVAATDLMSSALALAEQIAANAPLAVQASKRLILGIEGGRVAGEDRFWRHSEQEMNRLRRSEDWHEGPRAFAEKREPTWKGR